MANRRPRLAIVGASVRAAAFSAIRGGFDVVAADMFADADLRRSVGGAARIEAYPNGLPFWLANVECDAWLYTGALENHLQLIDFMSGVRPLLGNASPVLHVVRDPHAILRAAEAAELSAPEIRDTSPVHSGDESWVCKTYRGASGSGVWRFDGNLAAERAKREGAVFQRYVEGESAAAVFVVAADQTHLLGVTRQLLRDDDPWKYAGSVGPLICSPQIQGQLARLGEMLRELGARGIVGVDLVLADERAWIIEINPRYTASVEVLERATGVSAIAAHTVACDPTLFTAPPAGASLGTGQIHAKRILFASRDVQVSQAFHEWAMERSSLDPRACQVADVPHAGEEIPAGRPVATAFAAGETEAEAIGQLARRVGEMERRL